ncbi:hypothetical protein, partial [Ruminobacter sp.]|uniref:hypothetical protein n=1 Tax=Ruminobacter sp. TaxID=2774296 RepID=UPI0038680536
GNCVKAIIPSLTSVRSIPHHNPLIIPFLESYDISFLMSFTCKTASVACMTDFRPDGKFRSDIPHSRKGSVLSVRITFFH